SRAQVDLLEAAIRYGRELERRGAGQDSSMATMPAGEMTLRTTLNTFGSQLLGKDGLDLFDFLDSRGLSVAGASLDLDPGHPPELRLRLNPLRLAVEGLDEAAAL